MSLKITEKDLPLNYRIKYNHIHPGNTKQEDIKETFGRNARYVTVAYLEDDKRRVVGSAVAICSKKDSPRKKMGRDIAKGRLLKNYQENLVANNSK